MISIRTEAEFPRIEKPAARNYAWMDHQNELCMKLKRTAILTVSCSLLLTACSSSEPGVSRTPVNLDANKPGVQDGIFVHEALASSSREVEMSRLAVEKAENLDLRLLAQRMYDDHTRSRRELSMLAKQVGIPLPEPASESEDVAALKELSDAAFDRAYINHVLENERADLKKFEAAARNARNADVRSFAAKTAPAMIEHLRIAENVGKLAQFGIEIKEPAGAERPPFYGGDPQRQHQFNQKEAR